MHGVETALGNGMKSQVEDWKAVEPGFSNEIDMQIGGGVAETFTQTQRSAEEQCVHPVVLPCCARSGEQSNEEDQDDGDRLHEMIDEGYLRTSNVFVYFS